MLIMEKIKTKRCPKCGRELPTSEFYPSRHHSKDGLMKHCKECREKIVLSANRRMRETKKANAEARKERKIQPIFHSREDVIMNYLISVPPRYLFLTLKKRGYEGILTTTRIETIDIKDFV